MGDIGRLTFRFDAIWFIEFSAKTVVDGFNGLGTVILSLIAENPRSRFILENLELMLLLCGFWILICFARSLLFFAGLLMVPTLLLFFRDFFWRLGLPRLEYWILAYVRGHWFGCSLWPETLLNPPCREVGFICPFVVINTTYSWATTVRR